MRNLKKFFALVLAMLMIVSATAIVSADFADVAADNIYAKAINDLADKKITVGGDSGFNPDGMVTRWQMALFVARAMTGEVDNAVWANGINIFDDVNDGHYKGAISHAYLNNVILGVGDNKFNPDGNITYGAALKMAVCALGYEVKYDATNWALAFYGKAQELGLTAGVSVYDLDKELTRAETAQIIYNMIYAAPAAKDAKTFAAANFGGIIGVAEDTLFVITATPKQHFGPVATTTAHFADTTLVDATKYVGIQALKNGAPAGEVVYVLAADLGITGDVEDYLNRSVVLTNYKDGGKFDTATIGKAPVAVRSADLVRDTKNTSGDVTDDTWTYDGKAYSLVAELTNSKAKNELVLLNGGASAGVGSVDLTFDEETGNVLDPETLAVYATYKATKPNGEKVYLLASDGTTVVTYAELLEVPGLATTTGEAVDDVYSAETVVPGASVIYLFDDYGDARFERAIAEDVLISSYYTETENVTRNNKLIKDAECDMLITELEIAAGEIDLDGSGNPTDYVKVDEVTYSDETVKAAGTVFTFTYNAALNEVTVLDIADKTTAKLTGASTKKDSVGNSYNMVVLGGKTYYNDSISTTFAGATLVTRDVNSDSSLDAFAAGEYFNANAGSDYKNSTAMNKNYTFYSIGEEILYIALAEEASTAYEFIVYKEFNDIDLADILVDVYANGKLKEAASIYGVEGGLVGDYADDVVVADIADKNLAFTAFATAVNTNIAYGTVYAATSVDGAYYLEKEITTSLDSTALTELGLIEITSTNDGDTTIDFDGKNSTAAKEYRLRTNSNTVFYFIDTNAATADKVSVYVGAAANEDFIKIDANTKVFVDKLGIGTNPENGIAKTVFVIGENVNPDVDGSGAVTATYVKGFGFTDVATIAATDKIVTTIAADRTLYEYKLASDFGLDVKNASTTYYYATTVVNAADASTLVVYSAAQLESNSVYVVDANGIVKSEAGTDIALTSAYHAMFEYVIDDVTARTDFYTDEETGYLVLECGAVTIDADQKINDFKVIDKATGKIYEGKDAKDAIIAGTKMYVVKAVKDAIDDAKAIDGGVLVCIVDNTPVTP